jgi:Fur family transcriptional regulator, ferric uptake regulator
MNIFNKSHDCKEELRTFKLKATPIRLSVTSFLEKTQHPIDANSIISFLKTENIKVDPATIFRMMNDFVKSGFAKEIRFEKGKARYELASKGDHHHLICESCGKIDAISDNFIPELEKEIEDKHKFLVKRHTLEFFGLCKDCLKSTQQIKDK